MFDATDAVDVFHSLHERVVNGGFVDEFLCILQHLLFVPCDKKLGPLIWGTLFDYIHKITTAVFPEQLAEIEVRNFIEIFFYEFWFQKKRTFFPSLLFTRFVVLIAFHHYKLNHIIKFFCATVKLCTH